MNKVLSLLLAGIFFLGIVMSIAALFWFTGIPDEKRDEYSSPINQQPVERAVPFSHIEPPPSVSFSQMGYKIHCQINDPEGKPVDKSTVVLTSLDGLAYRHSTATDASGYCRILVLQEGQYRITADAPGFSPVTERLDLTHTSDRTLTKTLTLRPPAYTLRGWVFTHAGKPVNGATVTCRFESPLVPGTPRETEQLPAGADTLIVSTTNTPRNGSFCFERLPRGLYRIAAEKNGYLPIDRTIPMQWNQSIAIQIDEKARLNGVVTDEWNRPIEGATASIQSQGRWGTLFTSTTTQANGRFVFFNLPPQTTLIHVEMDGYSPQRETIEIAQSVHEIPFRLAAPPISIQGKVVNAITGEERSDIPLELYDWRINDIEPFLVQETHTRENGAFLFSDLLPADYSIRLAESEEKRFSPTSLDIPRSLESIENLIIKLYPAGIVSGQVANSEGQPVAQAVVELLMLSSRTVSALTDPEGRFDLPLTINRPLSKEGKEMARILASHPDYAAGFSEEFEFAPGESIENIPVILGKGFSIQGKVTTPQYRPIAGARIIAQVFESRSDRRETITDAEGNYRIGPISFAIPKEAFGGLQQVALDVRCDGYEYQRRAVPIPEGEMRTENFILHEAGQISGYVVLPDGSPASGAQLTLLGATQQTTESNRDGWFQFNSVYEVSTLQIIAQYGLSRYHSPNQVRQERNSFGQGAYFAYVLPIPINESNLLIVLQPENGVLGRVLDGETRKPIVDFKATLAYRFPQYDKYLSWSVREGTWNVPAPGLFGFSAPLSGEYLLTIEADGYVPTRHKIAFYENGLVKTLDVRLTQTGNGILLGTIAPYEFHGNIQRLQLTGRGVDWPIHITHDSIQPFSNVGYFQVDNVSPGAYDLFCIYKTLNGQEGKELLQAVEINPNQAADLGILDVSSLFVKSTPWPTEPR